ncbi:glycosyltransferase [Actinomadura alba]|uniref:Glycosyltransferase n=2 Tax=Actinomadura alba TaxID=406431 RepID=A0ABR7LXZ0_9ACTN|nr:glycosyltransferase [Actinomadura alba]
MFGLSRRSHRRTGEQPRPRLYVFILACLNEEKVIAASLSRITSLRGDNFVAMVIDDASDDGTAQVVRDIGSPKVALYQRKLPNARRGKGAALNAGLRRLREARIIQHYDPHDVIICVVDADGRLDPHILQEVNPHFDDPATGAVQVGVRMYNRKQGLLARLQDMEFVVYGDIFQSARRHIGSVGMGGNGQFMRLSALDSLPGEPWSDCLTEDLDLGVRLLAEGWNNVHCLTAAVHQQAVLSLGRLLRQRSRWFQGHMQAARLAPLILRKIAPRPAVDLLYHLSSPVLLLLTSLLPLSFLLALIGVGVASVSAGHLLLSPWWLPWFYLMTFGVASAYTHVYRKREPDLGFLRCVLLGHVYVLYGYIWFVSGWWAVGRTIRGRQTWLKTART